jgi:hypothetical protein
MNYCTPQSQNCSNDICLGAPQKFLTAFPTNTFLIFICACCSFVFIEKPFLKLKTIYT